MRSLCFWLIIMLLIIGNALIGCGKTYSDENVNICIEKYAYHSKGNSELYGFYYGENNKLITKPLNMFVLEYQPPSQTALSWNSTLRYNRDMALGAFLEDFDDFQEFTFLEWPGAPYNVLVFWADETIVDISFVSLLVTENLANDAVYHFQVGEIIHKVDELNPNTAIVLNVAFEHYILPRGGIIFTDECGKERRFFFHGIDAWQKSAEHFNLRPFNENHPFWDNWIWD